MKSRTRQIKRNTFTMSNATKNEEKRDREISKEEKRFMCTKRKTDIYKEKIAR